MTAQRFPRQKKPDLQVSIMKIPAMAINDSSVASEVGTAYTYFCKL